MKKRNDVMTTSQKENKSTDKQSEKINEFKKRMLLWPNPVEYVNNMYGCHPWEEKVEYFQVVFSKEEVVEDA